MKNYPEAEGKFEFNDRDKTEYTKEFETELNMALINLSQLSFQDNEYEWCVEHIPYIPSVYWSWLKTFSFDVNKIKVYLDNENHLHIEVEDKLYKATLYEVPILATVAELRNRMLGNKALDSDVDTRLAKKIKLSNLEHLKFSEFGTRRRFSYNVQDHICKQLKNDSVYCVGTSNVHFAMKYDMLPLGTMAHEFIMFHGSVFGFKQANYLMMEAWVNTFDGALGIALTDTYTSDVFFNNFSKKHAKLFDGVRQDSGDEYEFTNKAISRYKEHGIDPMTKTIVFSNALDFPKAVKIKNFCEGRINTSFGIGTNLTCDIEGVKPANIVMKLSKCRMNHNQTWENCLKISDDKGKVMGDEDEKMIFNLTFKQHIK
jgi:nicotinate phosphoribosyltransferase